MKLLRIVAVGLLLTVLSACVHNKHRATEAAAYYQAQATARQPLFELTAQPGETIQLTGVASLKVNDPRAGEIKALPVVQSQGWALANTIAGGLLNLGNTKVLGDAIVKVAGIVGESAGDRSTHDDHSVHVADSYNDSSDNSTHGDTITDSYNQDNDNTAGDGSAIGDRNEIVNGDNAGNSGQIGDGNRQGSDGPFDDHSNPGDDPTCTGTDCQSVEPAPVPAP